MGKNRLKRKIDLEAYIFILPYVFLSIFFMWIPITQGIRNSFFDFKWGFDFVGLGNYLKIFSDSRYLFAIRNSIMIVLIDVPMLLILGILISGSIFDKNNHYISFVRVCLYIPVVCGLVAMTIIWRFMLDSQTGLVRFLSDLLHTPAKNLLGDKFWAMVLILLILIAVNIGQAVVLYVAQMNNIDKSIIEALEIDGGKRYHLFRYILIPLTLPTTIFLCITQSSALLSTFIIIQLLTSGGPSYSTSTMMYLLYEEGFKNGEFGLASALGVIMFIFSLVLVVFLLISFKSQNLLKREGD